MLTYLTATPAALLTRGAELHTVIASASIWVESQQVISGENMAAKTRYPGKISPRCSACIIEMCVPYVITVNM